MIEDAYFTLETSCSHEIKVKGSRFIGDAAPVSDRHEAEKRIRNISKKYYNATHHCFAYRFGMVHSMTFRYSDAGEPAGTAGKPILNAIEGYNVTNVLCVVSRYFGGTKLGTGGLARAYARCANETLDKGRIVRHFITEDWILSFEYDLTGLVMPVISKFDCQIRDRKYGTRTELTLQIKQSKTLEFKRELVNITGGKVKFMQKEGANH